MDFDRLLDEIKSGEHYAGQLLHVREAPARPAHYGELKAPLTVQVQDLLEGLGIRQLYSHQAAAIEAVLAGENVTVVSGTASGKTLTYLVPIIEALHHRPASRSLLVYPTKALAQDQLRKLRDFGAGERFLADTYDGDTPTSRRRNIKKQAQVVLTNPDMLHVGILPYHHTWSDFLRNLRYVVLDEVHTYRGVFGSHTANVIRRLRRVAGHYGASPQFICCSATIANPDELARQLTGLAGKLVADDGAPRGRKLFAFWNPPVTDKVTGHRRSGNLEAADWLVALVRRQVRNIVFTLARSQAELILRYARSELEDDGLNDQVMAYRGGYLPAERREIERRLFSGELLGVTATTALELGVDIGGLDAVVMAGYPGSIASTWQQAGRAGRGRQDSLAVLIGLSGAVHQYVVNNPEYLLGASHERAVIDAENSFILAGHLLCAAYELPVEENDQKLFGPKMESILEVLTEAGYLARRKRWYWVDPDLYPAREISIRSVSGTAYDIWDVASDALLGTMDAQSAFRMIHPGAVYLHGGRTYLVEELSVEEHSARVRPAEVNYYTRPMVSSEVRKLDTIESSEIAPGLGLEVAQVSVRSHVDGYMKIRQVTEQQLGAEVLDLPMENYETVGLWLLPGPAALSPPEDRVIDLAGALHAIEHVLIMLLPLVALCDQQDVGGVSSPLHPDVSGPAICLYDGYPGGVGIAENAYDHLPELLAAAAETISRCPCEAGCPGCVQQASCGSMNRPLDKRGALGLIESWARQLRPESRTG